MRLTCACGRSSAKSIWKPIKGGLRNYTVARQLPDVYLTLLRQKYLINKILFKKHSLRLM